MVHFIMDCPALEVDRNYELIKKTNKSSQDRMIDLLFRTDRFQEVGCMIRKLWQRRRKLLTYIQKDNEKREKSKKNKNDKPHSPAVLLKSDPGPVREGPVYPRGRSL